ncbi:DUF2802 domain-containing protein [Lacimicrobium sp. SS2-24]|uniref:DUF2802 domain-containing protein n=1 Tax=Lacimicrobium sp. SS2-24 TaxID=2005569 RepID=UPI000B4BF49F|nr:DUF2802 domain-containing protein [Lacimicrobium sp. SS2-24]
MTLIEALLFGFLIVLAAGVVRLFRQQQTQQGNVVQCTEQLSELNRQLTLLTESMHELRSGSIGVGKKVKGLEAQLRQLQEKQQQLEEMEPESKLYSGAVKLLQQGASVEEVMQECELPRAEAELLFSLHGKG